MADSEGANLKGGFPSAAWSQQSAHTSRDFGRARGTLVDCRIRRELDHYHEELMTDELA